MRLLCLLRSECIEVVEDATDCTITDWAATFYMATPDAASRWPLPRLHDRHHLQHCLGFCQQFERLHAYTSSQPRGQLQFKFARTSEDTCIYSRALSRGQYYVRSCLAPFQETSHVEELTVVPRGSASWCASVHCCACTMCLPEHISR